MPSIPQKICEFLLQHHVLSLAIQDAEGPWAASCFYACDLDAARLLVLTSPQTRHGRQMALTALLAGTISGQPEQWRDICGVQFVARATLLTDEAARRALDCFTARHPIAKLGPSAIWALELQTLKYTSNRYMFGQKTWWQREDTDA